jgi:HlyD family secretion protein
MNDRRPSIVRGIFAGRRIWQAAVIAAATVLGAVLFFAFRGKGNGPEYRTEIVSRGDIQAAVTATGTVNAVTTVLVGTQVSGTIKNIYADFNSPVKKGQLIAQIDPEMLEAQAGQARANLEKTDAQVRDAERTLKRNRELFSRNLIARSELDTAETNFESARAQQEQARAALKVADTNLRYTRIISPVDGVVISRNVDVGQTVAASFQTPTLFTIAQDLTKMQIDTNVAEADIGSVKVGQEAEFTVDAYPDSTFKGKAWQIRRAPITVQNVVTYDVVIQVPNRDLRLMPGMTANVSIVIATKKDALKIPNGALRFRPSERRPEKASTSAERKGPAVWVLEKGTPKRVAITPGISDGNYTEVLSGELKEGQEVIVEALTKPKGSPGRSGPRMF